MSTYYSVAVWRLYGYVSHLYKENCTLYNVQVHALFSSKKYSNHIFVQLLGFIWYLLCFLNPMDEVKTLLQNVHGYCSPGMCFSMCSLTCPPILEMYSHSVQVYIPSNRLKIIDFILAFVSGLMKVPTLSFSSCFTFGNKLSLFVFSFFNAVFWWL